MLLAQNSLSEIFILKIVIGHVCNILCNFLLARLCICICVYVCNMLYRLMCSLLLGEFLYLFNKF